MYLLCHVPIMYLLRHVPIMPCTYYAMYASLIVMYLLGNLWDTPSAQELFCLRQYFFKAPLTPKWFLLGSPMLTDPHPSQQHAGLHHAVWRPQQEVTRPKTVPTSPEKPGVDEGANQVPIFLVNCFTCTPTAIFVLHFCAPIQFRHYMKPAWIHFYLWRYKYCLTLHDK